VSISYCTHGLGTDSPVSPDPLIESLKSHADLLVHPSVPIPERVLRLRMKAKEIGISANDAELRRYLNDARRKAAGRIELVTAADPLDLSSPEWICDGILMEACINLLLAQPKVGKTSLIMALVGALHRGEDSFLEHPLRKECPPVLIIGTDQPERDWARILLGCQLAVRDAEGIGRLCDPPIIGLAHAGCPWQLDEEGIERIAQMAEKHNRLLIIVDSLSACTRTLGLNENSPEFASPVIELMEAVGPYKATLVVIHHMGKGKANVSVGMSSRGSTALPAAASQIIELKPDGAYGSTGQNKRVVLRTEGRAANPITMGIERDADGTWRTVGTNPIELKRQQLEDAESSLQPECLGVLKGVRELMAFAKVWVSTTEVANHLQRSGDNAKRTLRRHLERLVKEGLLDVDPDSKKSGSTKRYRAVDPPQVRPTEHDVGPLHITSMAPLPELPLMQPIEGPATAQIDGEEEATPDVVDVADRGDKLSSS